MESKYQTIIDAIQNADGDDGAKQIAIMAIKTLEKRGDKAASAAAKREASIRRRLDLCDRNEDYYEKHEAGEITYEEIAKENGVTINTAIEWVDRGSPRWRVYYRSKVERKAWDKVGLDRVRCPYCGTVHNKNQLSGSKNLCEECHAILWGGRYD